MKPQSGCHHRLLSRSANCRVVHCTHGKVHLSVGALTLQLEQEQLAELATTLEVAMERLRGDSPYEERPARLHS